jgi:hypothetical protein
MATPTAEPTVLTTLTTDRLTDVMKFNDSHRMSIFTYSILMAVSAVANITVLVNILRRRRALRFGNNYMFMHLAIADLLVSVDHKYSNYTPSGGSTAVCRPALGPTQPPFRFVQEVKGRDVKLTTSI